MVELYWPRRGRFRDLERGFVAVGDGVYNVDDDAEEQYLSRGWEQPDEAEDDTGDDNDDGDGDTGDLAGYDDVESFLDRTPMSDVVDDIEAGAADGHLGEILTQATREGVKDAAGSRQGELDGHVFDDAEEDTDESVEG